MDRKDLLKPLNKRELNTTLRNLFVGPSQERLINAYFSVFSLLKKIQYLPGEGGAEYKIRIYTKKKDFTKIHRGSVKC
jgi:hypothetical protein